MIVKKPIGAVKVGNISHKLTIGKKVPKVVIDFWKKTKQVEALKNGGFIGESEKVEDKPKEKPGDSRSGNLDLGNSDKK